MADSHTLYAAYFHATRTKPNGDTEREQYILIPQRAVSTDPTPKMILFHRDQTKLSHRAVWRAGHRPVSQIHDTMMSTLHRLNRDGWTITPLITVQITHAEHNDAYGTFSTPYKILNRIGKVAKRKGVAL